MQDLRFLGQTVFGIYRDECEGMSLNDINESYGVHGARCTRKSNQTGAGHPADEEVSRDEETSNDKEEIPGLAEDVRQQQQSHANEHLVHVPMHRSPFGSMEDEAMFFEMFRDLVDREIIPDGFGITPEELEQGHYPTVETIRLGRRRSTELQVSLADDIWYERACLWCQAVVCLMYFMNAGRTIT